MKRLPTNWVKRIAPCALLVLLFAGIAALNALGFGNIVRACIFQPARYQTHFEPGTPPAGSLQELYQDVWMTALLPYMQQAVDEYYKENAGYSPIVYPYEVAVLSIGRPDGYRTFSFEIKLEVTPYLGPHYPVGVDHVAIRVSPGQTQVQSFEHIKSYPVPARLR